ncbi:hypothetical protein B9H02_02210 [Prosthecochloris sp. HL-130-GSB]|jgi:hypothetical protein|nr:hypothetical protein B9H02_02210 [Prosthecochloris sp. HL-130-GSB]
MCASRDTFRPHLYEARMLTGIVYKYSREHRKEFPSPWKNLYISSKVPPSTITPLRKRQKDIFPDEYPFYLDTA